MATWLSLDLHSNANSKYEYSVLINDSEFRMYKTGGDRDILYPKVGC